MLHITTTSFQVVAEGAAALREELGQHENPEKPRGSRMKGLVSPCSSPTAQQARRAAGGNAPLGKEDLDLLTERIQHVTNGSGS